MNDDEPSVLNNARVMLQQARSNEHDFGGPLERAYFETAREAAAQITCPHCDVTVEAIPAAGARWVLDEHHEAHCPKYVGDGDAVLYPPGW